MAPPPAAALTVTHETRQAVCSESKLYKCKHSRGDEVGELLDNRARLRDKEGTEEGRAERREGSKRQPEGFREDGAGGGAGFEVGGAAGLAPPPAQHSQSLMQQGS